MKILLRTAFFAAAIAIPYVYWQSSRGILVVINNRSNVNLHDVQVVLRTHGPSFYIGDVSARTIARTRVHAGGEADAQLMFRTPSGEQFAGGIVGYFESGYCGRVDVTIGPSLQIDAYEKINSTICF